MDSSPFSTLPRELRDLIYLHTFTTHSDRAITLQHGEIQHPLTRTCRTLREETLALYFSLTRFNAHLDDGPATPLARWLVAMGKEQCLGLREVNIWDLHMLNGTLHGVKATEDILRDGPKLGESSLFDGAAEDDNDDRPSSYALRPVGQDIFTGSFYLVEIVLALHPIGLELQRFCKVRPCFRGAGKDATATTKVKQTSHFAIQPSSGLGLLGQFGLTAVQQEDIMQDVEAGRREANLHLPGYRCIVFVFDEEKRIVDIRRRKTLS